MKKMILPQSHSNLSKTITRIDWLNQWFSANIVANIGRKTLVWGDNKDWLMDQVFGRRSSEFVQFCAQCRTAISLTVQRNVILLFDEEKGRISAHFGTWNWQLSQNCSGTQDSRVIAAQITVDSCDSALQCWLGTNNSTGTSRRIKFLSD